MIIEKLIDKEVLSETEKQIAQYILNKGNRIEDITSTELGKRSYTSQSAVTRLYKKLGVKTYREFLSKVIVERNEYFETIDMFDNIMQEQLSSYEGTQKVISGLYAQTMMHTNKAIDKNVVTRFCNRVLSSKMIDIYASGECEAIACQFSFKLQSLGIYCSCHNTYNPLYIQNMQNKTQRVFMIIQAGEVNDSLLSTVKNLRENKVYIASLSSLKDNGLSLYCQDNIKYSIGSYDRYEYICSYIAIEYILNIIYLNLLTRSTK